MKTILCPTDFSENALHALKLALEIAKKGKAHLVLFHAYWVPVYGSGTPPETKSKEKTLKRESLKELEKLQKNIALTFPSISTEIEVSNGFTADAIVEVAEKKKADLIVMGTKGATGLREIIMGSNTVDVIHKSELPVLVVPQQADNLDLSRFVFATGFHDEDLAKIEFLVKLASLFEAEIALVHVTEDDFILETTGKAMLQQFKKDVRVKTHYEKLKYKLLVGEVEEELQKYMEENHVSLLTVVNTTKEFLTKIFGKSITQKMAFHTKIPLLVLHK